MIDVLGAVITLLRADTAVAAIVGSRVRGEVLTGEAPPLVVIEENAVTRRPWGLGSPQGYLMSTIACRCYGVDSPTGGIQARQLAGAVSDALHNARPGSVGGKYLLVTYAPDIGGTDRDPDLRWPVRTVIAEIYAAAEAVA